MSRLRARRTWFDHPARRDRLVWLVAAVAACGAVGRLVVGDPWWSAAISFVAGASVLGVVLGSARQLVRGFREHES